MTVLLLFQLLRKMALRHIMLAYIHRVNAVKILRFFFSLAISKEIYTHVVAVRIERKLTCTPNGSHTRWLFAKGLGCGVQSLFADSLRAGAVQFISEQRINECARRGPSASDAYICVYARALKREKRERARGRKSREFFVDSAEG